MLTRRSPAAVIAVPTSASPRPAISRSETPSPSRRRPSTATSTGWSETRRTLDATEVCRSDAVQVRKCAASSTPLSATTLQSEAERGRAPARASRSARGARSTAVIAIRTQTMVAGPSGARRLKIAEKETATVAIARAG